MAKGRRRKKKTNWFIILLVAIVLLAAGYGFVHFGFTIFQQYEKQLEKPSKPFTKTLPSTKHSEPIKKDLPKKNESPTKNDYSARDKKALDQLIDSTF